MGTLCNLRYVQHRTVAVLGIFHVKNMTLIFDPSRTSKVKSDGANRKPVGPTYKSPGVQPRICHRFRDIPSQNFDVDLLTLVGLKFTKREDYLLPT